MSQAVIKKLYWLGNAAKSQIIKEILESHSGSTPVTVFDYGCGDGSDWPAILADHPWVQLIGYEPYASSCQKARKRLRNYAADIIGGQQIETLAVKADYIVSFSVFEHVVDREAYLRHAKRILASKGVFYLNYDDGHFRNWLDISQPTTWLPALRAWSRTVISRPLAAIGFTTRYQRRVNVSELKRLIAETGFRIMSVAYHNLPCLKGLAKTIPDEARQSYATWWLVVEKYLNEHFRYPQCGISDTQTNLWLQMTSCTLRLQHK